MKTKVFKRIAKILLCCTTLFCGCEKTIENYYILRSDPVSVAASIATYYYSSIDDSLLSEADVVVNNYDTVPRVKINNLEPNYQGYYDAYFDSALFNPGALCDLEITVGTRKMSGTVKMPETINVIKPAEDEVIVGRDLSIIWLDAKADYYDVYIAYEYFDGVNTWYYRSETIPNVADTSITLKDYLPSLPQGAVWYFGFVGVIGINGPPIKPGVSGNIKGDGSGFYWAYNYSKGSQFNNASSQPRQRSEIYKAYIQNYQSDLKERLVNSGFLAR
jgi:hypothetical protein